MIHTTDAHVIGLASDEPVSPARELPRLDLNAPEEIAGFILRWLEGERGLAAS